MTTGFARSGRLVQRSHIIDTVTNDVDLPHDSPMLHPNRIEGTDFSEFADYTALGTDMASRFPAEATTTGGEFDDTVLFNGRRTLKVFESEDYVEFTKFITGLPRVVYRTIVRIAPTVTSVVDEMTVGGVKGVYFSPNFFPSGILSYQPGDSNDDPLEVWATSLVNNPISQTFAALQAAGFVSVVAVCDLDGSNHPRESYFVNGSHMSTEVKLADTIPLGWNVLDADFDMLFNDNDRSADPDNNYVNVAQFEWVAWPDGYPCPFSGLEGLS